MAIRANRNLGRLYSKPPQHLNGHQRSGSYNKMWVHIFVCVIKNQQFPEYILKRYGDKFARCTACEKYKDFWDVHPIGTESLTIHQRNNIEHVNNQEAHRQDYYRNHTLSMMRLTKVLTIVHDKMDHTKTACLCYCPIHGCELLVWRQDNNEKCLLPDGDPKPYKPNPMKNGPEIIKCIYEFIVYWKELCGEDITRFMRDTHQPLIAYWDHICSALMTLSGDTYTTLTQGFWRQSRLTVVESETMFFSNEDVREEFAMDKHYVGPSHSRPAPSFRVDVDCYEGYMVLVRVGDEEHFKPI